MERDKPYPTSKLQAMDQLDFKKQNEWLLWNSSKVGFDLSMYSHKDIHIHTHLHQHT
ncbi:hypothetical protein I79_010011 [Cricetulus griseus]|uniref:Uncharacterized protein n=1 Tax=Cricetulus griseus TaxID=10029 RepID=G3HHB3_CRIGR|nr:hypothetical protein I79_010011 [Cricetulus griseus]